MNKLLWNSCPMMKWKNKQQQKQNTAWYLKIRTLFLFSFRSDMHCALCNSKRQTTLEFCSSSENKQTPHFPLKWKRHRWWREKTDWSQAPAAQSDDHILFWLTKPIILTLFVYCILDWSGFTIWMHQSPVYNISDQLLKKESNAITAVQVSVTQLK